MNNCKMCKMFQAHRPSEDRSIAGRLSPIDPNRGYPGPLADHPITGLGLYPDTMSPASIHSGISFIPYIFSKLYFLLYYKFSVYIHYP